MYIIFSSLLWVYCLNRRYAQLEAEITYLEPATVRATGMTNEDMDRIGGITAKYFKGLVRF